jgi:hypothetical protein
MYLFYCDETNLEERSGDFLIYGGLAIDATRAGDLSKAIDALRTDAKIDPLFQLKFNPGPDHLSHADFSTLKQRVITTAAEYGATLFVYAILHDIAKTADEARRNGINIPVCYHFDCFLNRAPKSTGLVLVDRFNDAGNRIDAHLVMKFSVGVTDMPYSDEVRLSNIVGFHYSSVVGQSHFPSIVDIVLGSLRFAINAHTRKSDGLLNTANRLLALLSPLFHRHKAGSPISEFGFLFSPKVVRSDLYRGKYKSLKDFLAAAGLETEQQITSERNY